MNDNPDVATLGPTALSALGEALTAHGLLLRGGFHPHSTETGLEGAGTVLLVGNAGPAMWNAFSSRVDGAPHPLDRWTRRVVEPIAGRFGARALYPFGPDAPPFQRWAERSETLFRSPLGILIHPEYGLWHAYRAALLFADRLALPARSTASHPCETCVEKPCLAACPVQAFDGRGYDVPRCAAHLASLDVADEGGDCLKAGCRARGACPVGTAWRYPEEQLGFHMAAFARSLRTVSAIPASGR